MVKMLLFFCEILSEKSNPQIFYQQTSEILIEALESKEEP